MIRLRPVLATLVALILPLLGLADARPRVAQAADACVVPRLEVIRGKDVILDQCYDREFENDGTDYVVHTYYTEDADNADNLAQCTDEENAVDRCEHALTPDGLGGAHAVAVKVATKFQAAAEFYLDRDLPLLSDDGTEFELFIAEDPKNGWKTAKGYWTDDDGVESWTDAYIQQNAVHELQHLMQEFYNDGVGFRQWWSEGFARTVEDRTHAELDATTSGAVFSDAKRLLQNSYADSDGDGDQDADEPSYREDDMINISYRNVLWWTWFMDRYRTAGESDPTLGWDALVDLYDRLAALPVVEGDDGMTNALDIVTELDNSIRDRGSDFYTDYRDYTAALYAFQADPLDERLGFLDPEITSAAVPLSGHNLVTSAQPYGSSGLWGLNPRSSQHFEVNPAGMCPYVGFGVEPLGDDVSPWGTTVMSIASGQLRHHWTTTGNEPWSRTLYTGGLDSIGGVVTGLWDASFVNISHGCVDPSLTITSPTADDPAKVGAADDPAAFIVRTRVTGAEGEPVSGLSSDLYEVTIKPTGQPGPVLPATVISGVDTQGAYWLLVQAPDDIAGAVTDGVYDVTVTLPGGETASQVAALHYVAHKLDRIVVLDRSGSMGGGTGKIEAARSAGRLLVDELAGSDQGGYVAFHHDAALRVALAPMNAGQRTALENSIQAEAAGGNTSIGDGLLTAATEEDAHGSEKNGCAFALLTDGYENDPSYWDDVKAGVLDNGCAIDAVAFGPEANEDLLYEIAAAQPSTKGSFAYAPRSGNVPVLTAAGDKQLAWGNNLARLFDASAARGAARQRIASFVGSGATTEQQSFVVDASATELVLAIAWPQPLVSPFIQPMTPANVAVPVAFRFKSPQGTHQIWRIPNPQPGTWKLLNFIPNQQSYVGVSAVTKVSMHLFVDSPQTSPLQGLRVPLKVAMVQNGQPGLGATVTARVTAPDGVQKTLLLHDDGDHRDGDPGDGVYGNVYSRTPVGEVVVDDPHGAKEGQAPASVGSYRVEAVGLLAGQRREDEGAFVVRQDVDKDGDGLPDGWETDNGLDPLDPTDGRDDSDGDGLINRCELAQGTHPNNPDTDAGGESDGSETPNCNASGMDPLDGADDRVGRSPAILVSPQADSRGPRLVVGLARPSRGTFRSMNVYRQVTSEDGRTVGDWQLVGRKLASRVYVDRDVQDGRRYAYRIEPTVVGTEVRAVGGTDPRAGTRAKLKTVVAVAAIAQSTPVEAKADPYAPEGSLLIDDDNGQTTSRTVRLRISALDDGDAHGADEPSTDLPGTPTAALQMRLSNSADFSGAAWRPLASQVPDWDLGELRPGQEATVFVQFRDAAGNVGEGNGQDDSTVYVGGR